MEMADNPKLDLASCFAGGGLGLEVEEENMASTPQKFSILDHMNGFQSTKERSADSFIIDMETFSPRSSNKDMMTTPNSRITFAHPNNGRKLQRSLSRKGFQRGGEKKINCNSTPSGSDRDREGVTSSPRGHENSAVVSRAGTADHSNTPKAHHQITMATGNINGSGGTTEGRCTSRRNNMMKRSPENSWGLDPKRVLFIFATLSSIGTLLLIYFTLSVGKPSDGQET